MAGLFWRFCMYSFLGYLLERLYAAATRSPRQVRKGFLLLPLCPVYGLGILMVETLPPALTGNFFSLALWGGLAATAVEYAVHWAYDVGLGVKFWDYTGVWGNVNGRVSLPFSLAWGVLLAALYPWIQPRLAEAAASLAPVWTWAAVPVAAVDGAVSLGLLWRYHDPEVLTLEAWPKHEKKAV